MAVNQVINTDWVQLNVKAENLQLFEPEIITTKTENRTLVLTNQRLKGTDKVVIGKTVFKRSGNGNKFYRDTYTIFHRGNKFGTMLCHSKDKNLLPIDNFQIEVKNNRLYEKGWLDDLRQIMSSTDIKYKSFVRLDIAVDGGDFADVAKQWYNGTLDKVGRAAVKFHLTGKRKFEGYDIGKGKSKKHVTCYNKSDDIRRNNKWYIEKFWKRSGLVMQEGKDIQRCELRLRNEEGKKFKDIDWNRFDDYEHLASIMQSNLEKFYEWVIPDNQKNINRKKRFSPIDWNSLGAECLEKDSTRSTEEIWAGKVTCKKLIEIYHRTGTEHFRNMAYEIAMNLDAISWLNEREPIWQEDILHRLAIGEAPQWLTNFKQYNYNEQLQFFDKEEFKKKTKALS